MASFPPVPSKDQGIRGQTCLEFLNRFPGGCRGSPRGAQTAPKKPDFLVSPPICNSSPGIDMSAEVSCGLGIPEGTGKVDTTEANGRPDGLETAGGEAIKPTVSDPGDEAMAAELGNQA